MIIENHPNDSRIKIREDGICQTLSSRMGTGGGNVPLVANTLRAGAGTIKHKADLEGRTTVQQKRLRRLTPLECERLQGLPDNYTLIVDKSCSDSARYKAIGNGMAQPCADYVIKRIVEVSS